MIDTNGIPFDLRPNYLGLLGIFSVNTVKIPSGLSINIRHMGAKNLKPFKITWLEVLLVWNVPKFYTHNEVLKGLNSLGVLEDNQVSTELNF